MAQAGVGSVHGGGMMNHEVKCTAETEQTGAHNFVPTSMEEQVAQSAAGCSHQVDGCLLCQAETQKEKVRKTMQVHS